MSIITAQVQESLTRSSWIRKMFEAGLELKAKHGADKVFDFSIGSPDLPPPPEVAEGLEKVLDEVDTSYSLSYMPNPGFPQVRAKLAGMLATEQNAPITANEVIMTCGAAGGINCLFKAVLEPGDEILVPSPYFIDYGAYANNFGATMATVPTKQPDFSLDVDAIAAAITPKTRVMLINTPNNPTGAVYSREQLQALAEVLAKASAEHGKPILLVSDEPYRFLTYDGVEAPAILDLYPYSVLVNSFSKDLSMAGERLGYLALSPAMPEKAELMAGLILAIRILGFINAPAIGQKILLHALGASVDTGIYDARRKAMAEVLDNAGLEYVMPKGGFYFFVKTPDKFEDDVAFVSALQEQLVLAVPGPGFGCPGYVRLAFCVHEDVIRRSADAVKRAVER